MAGGWRALLRAARRYPWPTNVLLYAALFSAGDALQQRLRGGPADWQQTRRVATVAVTFHANFNYVWLRVLERALPGRAPRAVLAKVLCDQAIGGPVAVSAFYAGMSILQEKDDIFLDLKQKFWDTYKSGLMYWPFVQTPNKHDQICFTNAMPSSDIDHELFKQNKPNNTTSLDGRRSMVTPALHDESVWLCFGTPPPFTPSPRQPLPASFLYRLSMDVLSV
ncbi:mpv17-like protein isoform X1 [Felis catus]|uniref:BMERB domain containing 1 n=1 Tax=Felis catus TaxID=9685 RepID=A0ABI7XVY4_FELCA|nr:mpv17-like protein isoform X1 [Felis catus]